MILVRVPLNLPIHPYGRSGPHHAHRIPGSNLVITSVQRLDELAGGVARATPIYGSGKELGGVLLSKPAVTDDGPATGVIQVYRGEFVLPVNRVAVYLAVSTREGSSTTLIVHVDAPAVLLATAPTPASLTDTAIRQYGDAHDVDLSDARRALEACVVRARLAQHRAALHSPAPPAALVWTATFGGRMHDLLCTLDGAVVSYVRG